MQVFSPCKWCLAFQAGEFLAFLKKNAGRKVVGVFLFFGVFFFPSVSKGVGTSFWGILVLSSEGNRVKGKG